MSTALILATVLAIVASAQRLPFGMLAVIVVQSLAIAIGLSIDAHRGLTGATTPWVYLAGLGCLIAGWAVTAAHSAASEPRRTPKAAVSPRAVGGVVAVVGLFTAYHLIQSGIPLFSSEIEKSRFNFSDSGLFGIPGRMYLFGTSFAWLLASANAHARGIKWRTSRAWVLATTILIGSAALSGFKGRLIYAALTILIGYLVIRGRSWTIGQVSRRFWPIGLALLLNFFVVASLYSTVQRSGSDPVQVFWERNTTVASEPVRVVLDHRVPSGIENPIPHDIQFYVAKYAHVGTPLPYSFQTSVSAAMIGVSPGSTFTVPVTIGAFAELHYALGGVIALVLMTGAGSLGARFERGGESVMGATLTVFGLIALQSWIIRGDLVYTVLNYAAVALFLYGVFYLVGLVDSGLDKKIRTPRRHGS